MKTIYKNVKLNNTNGKRLIKDTTDFSYIDSDFKNWNVDEILEKENGLFDVYEMEAGQNLTFRQMFTDPEKQYMSQDQILSFIEQHKEKLKDNEYATFFLTKAHNKFFVVYVSLDSDGFDLRVGGLEDDDEWLGVDGNRFVVSADPESPSTDHLTLSSFVPHAPKIEKIYCYCDKCVEFYKQWNENRK